MQDPRRAVGLIQNLQMQGVVDDIIVDTLYSLYNKQKIQGEIEWFEQEVDRLIARKHPKGYEIKCVLYVNQRRYDEAIEVWKEAKANGHDTFECAEPLAGGM